ncbi:hypothetical protein [Nocardioides sp.]|uniref:hypothetical protein n=1 Tax=Nocardioides sp. TaxID=35761 RepID=UPI002EDB96BF
MADGESLARRLLGGGHGRDQRAPRLRDTARIRRRRAWVAIALLVLGLGCAGFGVVAGRAAPPSPIQLDPDGVTSVPATHFYQSPWVLYGQVDDPRRVPSLTDVGCAPDGDLRLPEQPDDMTQYGSRVIDGVSIAALALLSRSGSQASVRCSDAADYAPLWLMPSSVAEPFTATGIAILGAVLLVVGALVHPATDELPARWRAARGRRDER